jgi:hypothetical protein
MQLRFSTVHEFLMVANINVVFLLHMNNVLWYVVTMGVVTVLRDHHHNFTFIEVHTVLRNVKTLNLPTLMRHVLF